MRIPEAETARWFDIGSRIATAVPYDEWRDAPWLRVVITDSDEPGRVHAYELIELPHTADLEKAVVQWINDQTIPVLGHPASYLLALRFSTVGHLLMSFEGILAAPPKSSIETIYRQFLLRWWRQHGAMYAVGYSCSEYDVEG